MQISYPASGWLPSGAHLEIKWDDQGKDIATNWQGAVQAPGNGYCVHNLSDQPFPNGFGPRYPVVYIETGPWAGHNYYLGHTTSALQDGEHFSFGHVISHADQGHNWAGTTGGWIELGEAPGGYPGPKMSSHWFDSLIAKPLVVNVPDPIIKYGDSGWRIIGLSNMLKTMGYLSHLFLTYGPEVHGAVIAFKEKHHISMPPPDTAAHRDERGWVDHNTDVSMQHVRDWCKKTGRKDYP